LPTTAFFPHLIHSCECLPGYGINMVGSSLIRHSMHLQTLLDFLPASFLWGYLIT
jgi:hypothetical protein